jgi:hypothetical protein
MLLHVVSTAGSGKLHSDSELPYDIWSQIAGCIPQRDLHRLLSVHRAFFDIALGRKYSHVEWTKLDEDFIHFLNRLQ